MNVGSSRGSCERTLGPSTPAVRFVRPLPELCSGKGTRRALVCWVLWRWKVGKGGRFVIRICTREGVKLLLKKVSTVGRNAISAVVVYTSPAVSRRSMSATQLLTLRAHLHLHPHTASAMIRKAGGEKRVERTRNNSQWCGFRPSLDLGYDQEASYLKVIIATIRASHMLELN